MDNITRKVKDRDVNGYCCHKEHEDRETMILRSTGMRNGLPSGGNL